jgi:exopolyphosphatase/guanosine-5'-triphosphate,3'-diphosphate pyrophosphatase
MDIGTNSTKMTAAEVSRGQIDVLAERGEITRLGRGVDATKRFSDEAVAATLAALEDFAAEARSLGIRHIAAAGTSAMREAVNGEEFRARARAIIGCDIEIVSGAREAQLTFLGAISDPSLLAMSNRILAFDVGGGSTELILGTRDRIECSRSLNIGAVRLTERILLGDPPTAAELAASQEEIDRTLAEFARGKVDRIIGIGGTATTVAAMLSPSSAGLQGSEVVSARLDELFEHLAGMSVAERRGTPGLHAARADVIVAGMQIIKSILKYFGKQSYFVSTRGVRHGLLLEMSTSRAVVEPA